MGWPHPNVGEGPHPDVGEGVTPGETVVSRAGWAGTQAPGHDDACELEGRARRGAWTRAFVAVRGGGGLFLGACVGGWLEPRDGLMWARNRLTLSRREEKLERHRGAG